MAPAEAPAPAEGTGTTARDGGPGLHADASAAGRHRVRDARQHGHQQTPNRPDSQQPAAPQDQAGAWPPSKADQDSARALYAQDFGAPAIAPNAAGGRDRGTNVAGDMPGKSPGDTSDLPPTGEELLEMEDDKDSRIDKLRHTTYREFGDVADAGKDQAETVRNLLERPPPAGHPEVPVNARPVIGPEVAQHATVDVGSAAELTLVLGVMAFQAGRWIDHKVEDLLRR